MFYQGMLVVAYGYAHVVAPRLPRGHFVLLLAPLLFLPPGVEETGGDGSSGALLLVLLRRVAVPFAVLATSAVVAQRWWAHAARGPYGLYAVSNAGSLVALAVYVLLVEPAVGLQGQRWAWSVGYVLYLASAWFA